MVSHLQEKDIQLLKEYYKKDKTALTYLKKNKNTPKSVLKIQKEKPTSLFTTANTFLVSVLLIVFSQVVRDYSNQPLLNQIIIPISWGFVGLFTIFALNYVNNMDFQDSYIIDYMLILLQDDQDAEELREHLRGKL